MPFYPVPRRSTRGRPIALLFVTLLVASLACRDDEQASNRQAPAGGGAPRPDAGPPTYVAAVVRRWPHDPTAYTQGLEFHDGALYESTGLEGQSSVRVVNLATGGVVRRVALPAEYFGEGITIFGGRLYQLTWKSGKGFIYDAASLAPRDSFTYVGEGWGLTHDARSLVMSDGTSTLRFLDPATLTVERRLAVTRGGQPVERLNELEWVDGEIYANVWQTDQIARIDPASGAVTGWIDLAGLLSRAERAGADSVGELNGIAYDPAAKRLFVTGKRWPVLFEIELRRRE
jgi:glutamine cyclotransferase